MKKYLKFSLGFIFLIIFISCKQKTKYGDFTIITEDDKYEALGGALKIDGHTLQFKNKEIDWSSIGYAGSEPNIETFRYLNTAKKQLFIEVDNNYYLLTPNENNVDINFIAISSQRTGLFESKPYSEILKNGLYFHQAGMRINLKTFKKDSLLFIPAGRVLAIDENANKIIYVNGIFDNDTNLKKTLDQNNEYLKTGQYNYNLSDGNYENIDVLEWDITNKSQYKYNYSDTTLWKALDEFYDKNSYEVLSTSFDSNFVFNFFKWSKDSLGSTHLIPKNANITLLALKKLDSLGNDIKN